MTRSRLTALFVSALLALPLAAAGTVLGAVPAGATAPECRWATRGYVENRWLGGAGSWSDATHWSRGAVPGVATRDYACIPSGSDVVIDDLAPRIDLDLLELGLDSRLTLRPGTALYLWGDQDVVRSITKRGSVIEADGAIIGGGGRLHVIGTLTIHQSTTGSPALLTTHADSESYTGPAGILEIGDEGTLDVRGSSDVRIANDYIVDIHGRARLRDDAGLVADHGTTFLLQPHYYGPGVGRLVILNDRGFLEGKAVGTETRATFLNRGRIVKRESKGTSRIQARYVEDGETRVLSGRVRLPGVTVTPAVLGPPLPPSCPPTVACTDPQQAAQLHVPASDTDGVADVSIAELPDEPVKGAVGVPMQVHAADLDATVADPAVIQLRYNVSLFKAAGRKVDLATVTVAHANGADDPFVEIPSCEGTGIPLGAFACLDRAASRKGGGAVVLVVRTVDTSRWVVP
jgi:hypothetical protein